MPHGSIYIALTSDERKALVTIAERECRDPRDHIRYLIRQDAEQRALIETKQKSQAVSEDRAPRNDPTDPKQV